MNRLLALILLPALLCGGCASARRGIGDNVTVPKIIEIIPGETTRSQIRTIFGKPDFENDLGEGKVEYTYLQGKNNGVSWLILSGYLVYHETTAFSGNTILIVRFDGETLQRFLASDGKLTIKKGYEEKAQDAGSEKED